MGADIHGPFLETMDTSSKYESRWWCQAEFDFNRNYWLFALMANVRNYDNDREAVFHGQPCFKPKGYPKDASWKANNSYFFYVDEDYDKDREPNTCSREDAERWVAGGYSFYKDETKSNVSIPDWHSASWLATDELEAAYQRYKAILEAEGEDMCYLRQVEGLLAAMKAFEAAPGVKARIVFWFDN